jgi:hypothetical protein
MTDKKDDYEVGYGKPPAHGRIKKGERRNPKGRPRGAKNVDTVLIEVMETDLEVRENGQVRKMSMTEAIIKKQVQKAIEQGDPRSAHYLLDRKGAIDAARVPGPDEEDLPVEHRDILEDYNRRLAEEAVAAHLAQSKARPKAKKKARSKA